MALFLSEQRTLCGALLMVLLPILVSAQTTKTRYQLGFDFMPFTHYMHQEADFVRSIEEVKVSKITPARPSLSQFDGYMGGLRVARNLGKEWMVETGIGYSWQQQQYGFHNATDNPYLPVKGKPYPYHAHSFLSRQERSLTFRMHYLHIPLSLQYATSDAYRVQLVSRWGVQVSALLNYISDYHSEFWHQGSDTYIWDTIGKKYDSPPEYVYDAKITAYGMKITSVSADHGPNSPGTTDVYRARRIRSGMNWFTLGLRGYTGAAVRISDRVRIEVGARYEYDLTPADNANKSFSRTVPDDYWIGHSALPLQYTPAPIPSGEKIYSAARTGTRHRRAGLSVGLTYTLNRQQWRRIWH